MKFVWRRNGPCVLQNTRCRCVHIAVEPQRLMISRRASSVRRPARVVPAVTTRITRYPFSPRKDVINFYEAKPVQSLFTGEEGGHLKLRHLVAQYSTYNHTTACMYQHKEEVVIPSHGSDRPGVNRPELSCRRSDRTDAIQRCCCERH